MFNSIASIFKRGKPLEKAAEVVPVVNQPQNVYPQDWVRRIPGPGWPVNPTVQTQADKLRASEPRTFQPLPNVNATLTPRLGYGLMSFADLRDYSTVPEVALCIRIITEELKTFTPVIKDGNGVTVQKAATVSTRTKDGRLRKTVMDYNDVQRLEGVEWMTRRPDGQMRWANWLSRVIYNVMVYDANALYRQRDEYGRVTGLMPVDGSTIFCIVDDRSNRPEPPAPAYQQIIWGRPENNYTSFDLHYTARRQRINAPYGTSFIEDALPAIQLLSNWWEFNKLWYQVGSNPAREYSAPPGWTPNQIFDYMDALNERYAGNLAARQQAHIYPDGFKVIADRSTNQGPGSSGDSARQAAFEMVAFAAGIPPSELGKAPGEGLGGKGYAEAGESIFFRMGLAPVIAEIKQAFDDALSMWGYSGYSWELEFPGESIDPDSEEEKQIKRWQAGLQTRRETQMQLGLVADETERGNVYSGEAAKPVDAPADTIKVVPSAEAQDTVVVKGQGMAKMLDVTDPPPHLTSKLQAALEQYFAELASSVDKEVSRNA